MKLRAELQRHLEKRAVKEIATRSADSLMSLSRMVENPRPFGRAQGMLYAKKRSVMPALRLRSG